MKKKYIVSVAVLAMLALTPTVMAEPLDVTGDFRLQGRSFDDTLKAESYFQFRTRIGFEAKLDDNTVFFSRLSAVSHLGESSSSALDQYGIKMTNGNWKFSLGRQAVNLGYGSIINTGNDAASGDNKFDGLVASTSEGKVSFNAIAGKTTATLNQAVALEWYGFDANVKLGEKVSAGLAYATNNTLGASATYKALNTKVAFSDKVAMNAEYVASGKDTDNTGYFIAGTYSQGKDSITLQYNKVDKNALDAYNSGIGGSSYPFADGFTDYKGLTYIYAHTLSKSQMVNLVYMDLQNDAGTQKDKQFVGSFIYTF